MRLVIILTLVLILVSISVFGFLAMDHSSGVAGNFYYCLASVVHGGVFCPKDLLSEVEFHFSAIQYFSLAIVSASFISFIGVGRLFILLAGVRSRLGLAPFIPLGFIRDSFFYPPNQISFIEWLSLHENSPTAV